MTTDHPAGLDGYESLGDVDAPHELSKADHRRQKTSVEIREHAKRWADEANARHAERQIAAGLDPTDPPESVKRAWDIINAASQRTRLHPEDLTVWRLRLYCGHVIERTAHGTHKHVSSAFTGQSTACTDCGLDPAVIIAAKAVRRPEASAIEALGERA